MKNLLCLLFLIFCSLSYSQRHELDKKLVIYKTFEDYKNNFPLEAGVYTTNEWNIISGSKISFKNNNGDPQYFYAKNFWGFKIGDYLFKGFGAKYPLLVLKEKYDKIFYMSGFLMLERIRVDSPKMSLEVSGEQFFFSDSIDSKVYDIDNLKSKAKENPAFNTLINCLKKAKKRHSDQGELDSKTECIMNL